MKNNTPLMVIARLSKAPEHVGAKMREFTDAEWMSYMGIAERSFNGAQVVIVLDADKNVAEARRVTGRNGNTFKLSQDRNAFGLENWNLAGGLEGKRWLSHPRVTATLLIDLDAKGNFNGQFEVVNWNEVDRAERDAAKAKTTKSKSNTTKAA